jgi:hypothetical protein
MAVSLSVRDKITHENTCVKGIITELCVFIPSKQVRECPVSQESKRKILKDEVVQLVKDFVTKNGGLSLQDVMNVLDETKNTLHFTPISFSLKD